MFSQKKRFYERKSFYGITLAALLAFGLWMNYEPGTSGGAGGMERQPAVSAGETVKGLSSPGGTEDSRTGQDLDKQDGSPGAPEADRPKSPDSQPSQAKGPCYLVQEHRGFIKIYFIDEAGGSQLIRTTDITFSLLSEGDQVLFQKGIVVETKEQLSELLQDFES